ncbi:class I SAM-dependent methyltransferase [Streptomyces olivaceus]|uniref:class I SAM-dependent methyltransferase n=1 Tax=Streptomyces olivaceus TaxID=47716 RepID=UPI0037AAE7C4
MDPYECSAEYLDLMIAETWQTLAPALTEVLHAVRAKDGPVADLGAGTGRGTEAICAALPGADPVLAVEPSTTMRAVLLSRVHGIPVLRSRVTVLAEDAVRAPLPDGLRAIVALNMLGHLPPAERRALWAGSARRLAPGGALIVNLNPPAGPEHVPHTRMTAVTVGARCYEGWASAEPSGDDQVTWRMDYRVLEGGVRQSEVTVEYRWWVASPDELTTEAAEAGLVMRPAGLPELGLFTLTHRDV